MRRRRRLLVLALTLALVGGVAGAVLAVQTPGAAAAPRLRAFFYVRGQAPRGVIVSYADSRSPLRVVEDGSVPLHANVFRHGTSFYEFRARILPPGGHITCKIGLGSTVVVSHASGAGSLCVVKARVPRGAGTGGGPDRASFGLKLRGPGPQVTAAMVTAAHRDEARLLRMFVPPSGAQRLSREPALFKRLRPILGVGPISSNPFARFSYWRVRSSVSAVAHFVLAHQPPGRLDEGCRNAPSTPLDRLCGVGRATGKGVPANASLSFGFPRIHGLVGERELRVLILRLSGGWTGIRVAATNHTWIPQRFRNRAAPPLFLFVRFLRVPGHPVAGQAFTGVKLVVADPKIRIRSLRCTAAVGHEVLRARKRVTFAASPPRGMGIRSSHGPVEEVACSWRIPADAAGKQLRLRNYSEHIGYKSSHLNPIAIASIAATKTQPSAGIGSPEYSWIVRPRS